MEGSRPGGKHPRVVLQLQGCYWNDQHRRNSFWKHHSENNLFSSKFTRSSQLESLALSTDLFSSLVAAGHGKF